jgi:hypothetical protein
VCFPISASVSGSVYGPLSTTHSFPAYGGGVYVDGTFEMSGDAEISRNTASSTASGSGSGSFSLNG